MTEERARELLKPEWDNRTKTWSFEALSYAIYQPSAGTIAIDDCLPLEELKALVYWMETHKEEMQ